MPRAQIRRRTLLIDRRVQLRSAIAAGVSVVAYSAILGFLIFFPLHRGLMQEASPELQVQAANQVMELHRRVWPAVLAVAILVGFHSVIVTHRMLGPVHRLKNALAALQAGDLSQRVFLRKHDQFKELAEAFNRLAAGLQQAESERKTWQEGMLARIDGLEGREPAVAAAAEGGRRTPASRPPAR